MNPYGAVERSLARLGGTARSIMGDIASQRVKAGQTELAREKMKYDISALQGKHKVQVAQIKATQKHREAEEDIQRTQMENAKADQDRTFKLNKAKFDSERDTLLNFDQATGILSTGIPELEQFNSNIRKRLSPEALAKKHPGSYWNDIFNQVFGFSTKKIEHKEKMQGYKQKGRILDIQEKTAEVKLLEAKRGPTEKQLKDIASTFYKTIGRANSARMGVGQFVPDSNRLKVAAQEYKRAKELVKRYVRQGGKLSALGIPDITEKMYLFYQDKYDLSRAEVLKRYLSKLDFENMGAK